MHDIKNAIQALNITLNENQAKKLYHFYNLVVEENAKINLTAITDFDEFLLKHYVDSLALSLLKDDSPEAVSPLESPNGKVFDLGTGGGFPGIPLAIVFPQADYTLLDSLQKRIRFLQSSVAELSLTNVNAIHGRAEDFARQADYREQFDLCVSRAVANLSTLAEYALPFVRVGGYFISYKGADTEEEIREAEYAVETLGGQIDTIKAFSLPGQSAFMGKNISHTVADNSNTAMPFSKNTIQQTEICRTLVVIKKIKSSGNKYPRRAGIPAKKPLIYSNL